MEAFDDELVFQDMENQLQVTLGQFSLLRLERQTQLLMPSYDYCMPEKACCDGDCGCPENPCEAFARMQFPVRAFFPAEGDTTLCPCQEEPVCPDSRNPRRAAFFSVAFSQKNRNALTRPARAC